VSFWVLNADPDLVIAAVELHLCPELRVQPVVSSRIGAS